MLVEFPSQKWMDYLATITGLWQPPKLYHNQMWANSSLSLTECNTTVAICPFWNANFNTNQKHSLLWSQANSSKHVSNPDLLCPKLLSSHKVAWRPSEDRISQCSAGHNAPWMWYIRKNAWILGFVCFVMFPLDDCVSMHGSNISPGILLHTQKNQFLPWVFLSPSMIGLHLGFFKSLDRFINAMVTIREPETTGHT